MNSQTFPNIFLDLGMKTLSSIYHSPIALIPHFLVILGVNSNDKTVNMYHN